MEKEKPDNGQTPNTSDKVDKPETPKDDKSQDSKSETKDPKDEKPQGSKSETQNSQDSVKKEKEAKISPDSISEKELFTEGARISDLIKKKYLQLEDAKDKLNLLEATHDEVYDLVKPQKRVQQRLGEPKKIEDADERKLRKTEKMSINRDVFLQKDLVDRLQEEFTLLCGNERNAKRYSILQIKADSKKYVRENRPFLLRKAKGLLEASLSEHRNLLLDLRRKSNNNSEEGISIFNSALRELLFIVDEEGAILCSGTASKTKIYAAIRTALPVWNPRSNTIPDLEWPADKE